MKTCRFPSWFFIFILCLAAYFPRLAAETTILTPYTVSLLCGDPGTAGSFSGGTIAGARFYSPAGIVVDSQGNTFVADYNNHTIRKITPAGVVTTFAGKAGEGALVNGQGSAARLKNPYGLIIDANDTLYIADSGNNAIRKLSPGGVLTTLAGTGEYGFADGSGASAMFRRPLALARMPNGDLLAVDRFNHRIRLIKPDGTVSTYAGTGASGATNGSASTATFSSPTGVVCDTTGTAYVADGGNYVIRAISPSLSVTTLAGKEGSSGTTNGLKGNARFGGNLYGLTLDPNGGILLFDNQYYNTIRHITTGGVVTTWPSNFNLTNPEGMFFTPDGTMHVADTGWHMIHRITNRETLTTIAGSANISGSRDGTGYSARFNEPYAIVKNAAGEIIVADSAKHVIRKILPSGQVVDFAGLYGQSGTADGTGSAARFNYPTGLALDATGNLYVADYGNHSIRKITPAGVVTTPAGKTGTYGYVDESGEKARFYGPVGIVMDKSGNLFVTDGDNQLIRKVEPNGWVSTLAGKKGYHGLVDGQGTTAVFYNPRGISIDNSGNLYVADQYAVRKVTPGGLVSTLAGSGDSSGYHDGLGSSARFNRLTGIAAGSAGDVYVTDYWNGALRHISASGQTSTLAGGGSNYEGEAQQVSLNRPTGLWREPSGALLITTEHHTIRRAALLPVITSDTNSSGVVGLDFFYEVTSAFEATAYGAENLPPGLGFNPATRLITGKPTAAGTYAVELTATNALGTSRRTLTLTIAKGTASLLFPNLNFTYDGAPKPITVTTIPAGLPVTVGYSYFSNSSAPISVGSYSVTATVQDANYTGTATGTLVISKGPQTISFAELPARKANGQSFTLSATATSGLEVSFEVLSGPATLSGSTLRLTGTPGTVTIRASQAGNASYLAAASVDRSFAVTAVTNDEITSALGVSGVTVTTSGASWFSDTGTTRDGVAAARSGYIGDGQTSALTLNVPTLSQVSFWWKVSSEGTFDKLQFHIDNVLQAEISGEVDWQQKSYTLTPGAHALKWTYSKDVSGVSGADAGWVDQVVLVTDSRTAQTLNFTPIPNRAFGLTSAANSVTLAASSSAGLTPVTYSVTSGPATVSGSTLSITGAGTITVKASQAGNSSFRPAETSQTFTVAKADQTIDFAAIPAKIVTSPAFSLAATATSGLPVTYTLVSGPATLSGSTLTLSGATGTVTVRAAQAGNANFNPATAVTQSFAVASGVSQTLTFNALPARVVRTTFTLAATASSGLPVTFSVVSGPATLGTDGKTVTVGASAGTVVIRATQPGGATGGVTYAPAETVERSFAVTLTPPSRTQKITFIKVTPAPTYGTAPITLSASADSGLPVSFELVSGPANLSGARLAFTGAGQVVVRAVQPGDATFKPATAVTQTIVVNKAPLAVTFAAVSRAVGSANPTSFAPIYSGFIGEDTAANLAANRPTGRTTATLSSPAGRYPITFTGGLDTNYRYVAGEPAFLTVVGYAGTYEALLKNTDGPPLGKVTLTVPTNSRAYSGTLNLASEANPVSLRGTLAPASDLATATHTFTRAASGTTPALTVALTVSAGGLSGSVTRAGTKLGDLTGTLLGTPPAPLGNAAYTLITSLPSESGAPAGPGFATATIAAKTGLLKLTGKLGDGTTLTASLSPSTDRTYRLWLNPYGKRLNSYVAGELVLRTHPATTRFPGLYHVPFDEGVLWWAKAASPAKPQDASYRQGFGPLQLAVSLDPWLPPSTKAVTLNGVSVPAGTLAQRLGLGTGSTALYLDHGAIDGMAAVALPEVASLIGSVLQIAAPDPTAWKVTSLNTTTGAIAGSFTLRDPISLTPPKLVVRTVAFSGVLRQRPTTTSSEDNLLGSAQFLFAPAGAASTTEKTSSYLDFIAP